MLLRVVGVAMMLDGVRSAMSAAAIVDTFFDRNLGDQSLFVANFLVGALLLISGRQLLKKRDRDSFPGNESRSRFAAATLVAALVLSGLETTRFDWPVFAARAVLTLIALVVLWRGRKTSPDLVSSK